MPEPSSSAGVSLTMVAIALLGPMAGPYAVIVFASLSGAMWPLSAARTDTILQGAWLLVRCTLTAVILTVFLAKLVERWWGFPVGESLAPVAMLIGAMGNGWRPVFSSIGEAIRVLVVRLGGEQR